jgi:hypothetical protein
MTPSPATALTVIGADADEPVPQPTKSMVATITMMNAKNRTIVNDQLNKSLIGYFSWLGRCMFFQVGRGLSAGVMN